MSLAEAGIGRWVRSWFAGSSDDGPPTGPSYRTRRAETDSTLESIKRRPRFTPSINEAAPTGTPGPRVTPSASWVYQLQHINPEEIYNAPADVAVVDYAPEGAADNLFTPQQVARMKSRPGGGRRVLISYMSIGEADQCRFYWRKSWLDRNGKKTSNAPRWLHEPNTGGWTGAWKVRFWEKEWQDIIIHRPDSYLNTIIDQGFDGVYLDIIDGYSYWMDEERGRGKRPSAGDDMIAFVSAIAHHARVKRNKPDFFVIPQNGEGLLQDTRYRAVVSAIGKEDILFEMDGQADQKSHVKPRAETGRDESVASIVADLEHGLKERPPIPVFAVEYLRDWPRDAAAQAPTVSRLRSLGLVPHLAVRDLGSLSPSVMPVDPPVA
jgi:cysteinyl-tRNA synthetase, unknown class